MKRLSPILSMDPNRYVTQFDSCSSMLHSLGHCLAGKPFAGQEGVSTLPPVAASIVNALPGWLRKQIYIGGGVWEAIPSKALDAVRAEDISTWVTSRYPQRTYPAVLIGSSNGAATHLGGILGIPWLPQTVLCAARRRMHVDELKQDIEWGRKHIRTLLDNNPELEAHQMHDPLQDRLMVSQMAYFRLKRLRLGAEYERFLKAQLAPGGTIILVECEYSWPVNRVGERHTFQTGGLGGIEAQEYLEGSVRVSRFLREQGSDRIRWDVDTPDEVAPEAEWGFHPALRTDAERFAAQHGYRLVRLVFKEPEDLSEFVADFHWHHYQQQGGATARRLLAECFGLVEPWWAMKTQFVPFWLAFTAEPSAARLERFLRSREPFEQIYLSLISNGVKAIGHASMDRWNALLKHGRQGSGVIGIRENTYPMDIGSFISYDDELREVLEPHATHEITAASLADVETFIGETRGTYPFEWITTAVPAPRSG